MAQNYATPYPLIHRSTARIIWSNWGNPYQIWTVHQRIAGNLPLAADPMVQDPSHYHPSGAVDHKINAPRLFFLTPQPGGGAQVLNGGEHR
jgi:hypothetical protein